MILLRMKNHKINSVVCKYISRNIAADVLLDKKNVLPYCLVI